MIIVQAVQTLYTRSAEWEIKTSSHSSQCGTVDIVYIKMSWLVATYWLAPGSMARSSLFTGTFPKSGRIMVGNGLLHWWGKLQMQVCYCPWVFHLILLCCWLNLLFNFLGKWVWLDHSTTEGRSISVPIHRRHNVYMHPYLHIYIQSVKGAGAWPIIEISI